MILNRIAPVVEQRLIKEQVMHQPTVKPDQHIEDGYQRGMITGAAFVDRSAAYDSEL